MKECVFISSVQKELARESVALRDFINGIRLLSKHFSVFLFEDVPARDRPADNLYLHKVESCDVFLAMWAGEYGREDPEDGLLPIEREFDRATQLSLPRFIFVKDLGNERQEPKLAALLSKARTPLVYRHSWFGAVKGHMTPI